MPTGIARPTSAAFSPQSIRDQIRGRVRVPAELLQEALDNLKSKLTAKETKFFSHQGSIVDKQQVEALGIQMQAIELIAKMSELVTTQAVKPPEPKITVLVDSKTGVMRIVIGSEDIEEDMQPKVLETESAGMMQPLSIETTATHIDKEGADVTDEEFESVIKVPRGRLTPELRSALFGDEPAVGGA